MEAPVGPGEMIDFLLKAVPVGFVGMWAAIGVVAAVILVRLRDGDFGFRVGAGLFAIGGAAVILMCSELGGTRTPHPKQVGPILAKVNVHRVGGADADRGARCCSWYRPRHGEVTVPRFED